MLLVPDNRTDAAVVGRIWQMTPNQEYLLNQSENFAWGNIVQDESDYLKKCPLNADHLLEFRMFNIKAEIFGVDYHPYGVVPILNHGFELFTRAFVESYLTSGLTGLKFDSSIVATEHISGARVNLARWDIQANCGIHFRAVKDGTTTFCLTCRQTPVLCPSCGKLNLTCKICNKRLVEKYTEDTPDLFVFQGNPEIPIVEGENWKGEDFFNFPGEDGITLCSDKARKWLERQAPGFMEFGKAILNFRA